MFGGLSGYSLLIYLTHWSVTRLGVVEVIGTLQLCSRDKQKVVKQPCILAMKYSGTSIKGRYRKYLLFLFTSSMKLV